MTTSAPRTPRHLAPKELSRASRNLMATLPIVLAGSMAVTMGLTSPVDTASTKRADRDKAAAPSELSNNIRQALAQAHAASQAEANAVPGTISIAAAPSSYRVQAGDTVSSIASRHGLSTASVLALNGLGWKSLIHPGQMLTLSKSGAAPITQKAPISVPSKAAAQRYTIVSGDTMGKIAARFGVSTQSLLTANGLGWNSIIYPGQKVSIPGAPAPAAVAPATPAPTPAPAPVTPPTSSAPPGAPPVSAPVAPPVTPPVVVSNGSYVIKAGDTVTSIANRHGVSVQSILNANGLSWSSMIYAGRTLAIPGTSAPASVGSTVTPLNDEMRANAATILAVGKELGVSDYGLVIALATAMQESTLRNLNWGDRDSLGLFQQRPSTGWGTPAQVTDPVHSSRLFFGGSSNPNRGFTRGLLDISGWESMTVTQAAQAVQISAYPNAYAKWEASAWEWLDQLN